ncbi:hypothetical protein [Maritimibacter dapengensis]|uniref:Uncharacterized protein n=1 Tax=Maritimibacter dapengensis TaxID=2836868 RepID=A0ABS6SZR4_9RHOB|nr:hypothetical protein [Maritimibacter dapengensis]MBV7378474.1 hypothetical protein [Maritimibacter dapengensis]
MIDRRRFDDIRRQHGTKGGSWAVWANPDTKQKTGIGELSLLDPDRNPDLLSELHADFVLVALNLSGEDDGKEKEPFRNFHNPGRHNQDFKLRYATFGTPLWGSYLTDLFKDTYETSSTKVVSHFTKNPEELGPHIINLEKELYDLGAGDSTMLVALGGATHRFLLEAYGLTRSIGRIRHYSSYISLEDYRDEVRRAFMPPSERYSSR